MIAADLGPVRGMGPRVRLLRSGEDPHAVLREVLAWPAVAETDRPDYVERNSWAARHAALVDFVLGPAAPAGPHLVEMPA